MITEWGIYWITRCDVVVEVFAVLSGAFATGIFLLAIVGTVAFLEGAGCDSEDKDVLIFKGVRKTIFILLPFLILFTLVATLMPNTRDMAMIKMLPAIVNNEKIQGEAKELYSLAKKGLRNLVEDEATKGE